MTDRSLTKQLVSYGYAPGNYTCKCVTCGQEFVGDKRASRCEGCAERCAAAAMSEPRLPSSKTISLCSAHQQRDPNCPTCNIPLDVRTLNKLVVDGDIIAEIEQGTGDPAGTYMKYRGQIWVNDGWLDDTKARALRDWLTAALSDDSSAPETAPKPAVDLDAIAGIVKEAAEHIEDLCPRPGPYHPAFAALLELADKVKFVPRGPSAVETSVSEYPADRYALDRTECAELGRSHLKASALPFCNCEGSECHGTDEATRWGHRCRADACKNSNQ